MDRLFTGIAPIVTAHSACKPDGLASEVSAALHTHTADVSSAHRVHILRRTMSSHAAVGVAHSTGHWHDRHKLSRPRGAALGSFGTTDAFILLRFIASEALAIDFGASPKEFHPQWRRPLQHTTAGGGHSGPSGGSMPTREST